MVIVAPVEQTMKPVTYGAASHKRFPIVFQRMPFFRFRQQRRTVKRTITDDIAVIRRVVLDVVQTEQFVFLKRKHNVVLANYPTEILTITHT